MLTKDMINGNVLLTANKRVNVGFKVTMNAKGESLHAAFQFAC